MDREVRQLLAEKKHRGVILKGTPRRRDLKEGETQLRFVKGKLIEYVKYGNKIFNKEFNEESEREKDVDRVAMGDFLRSRPNWDSGWVYIEPDSEVTIQHSLGTKFFLMQMYVKNLWDEIFSISPDTYSGSGNNESGIAVYMRNDNEINVGMGNDAIYIPDNTELGSTLSSIRAKWEEGYLRIFAWKFIPSDAIPNAGN